MARPWLAVSDRHLRPEDRLPRNHQGDPEVSTRRRIAAAAIGLGVLVALTAASCDDPTPPNTAQGSGQQDTETAFAQQRAAVPYPAAELKDSLERRNIRERLLRTNQP